MTTQARTRKPRHTLLRVLAVALPLTAVLAGCGKSSYDTWIEGLEVAGKAERRECKLVFDQNEKAHVLNSRQVQACLEKNLQALSLFEEAKEAGHTGKDVDATIADTKQDIQRLKSMLKMVSYMERTPA